MSEHRATQTRYPWRATLRTAFAVVVGLAAAMPAIVAASGVPETSGAVAIVVGVSGALTRILALPQVDALLRTFVPWLAAEPKDHPVR